MAMQLDSDKLYNMYTDVCMKYNSEVLSKEAFGLRIMEALYYLMSAMVEEETHVLSMTFKVDETLACLVAPFSGGQIYLCFDKPELIKEKLDGYKDLVNIQKDINPTELF